MRNFIVLILAILLAQAQVGAVGTVRATSLDLPENDGTWKLSLTLDYGSTPASSPVPMSFQLTPTAIYERVLTDASPDQPVSLRTPLSVQAPLIEPCEVGFGDASGKTYRITRFELSLQRKDGFEAGEYDLKMIKTEDGAQFGPILHLKLRGENAVVDRRTPTFAR